VNVGHLHRIERLNYALGGLAIIITALTQPQKVALGMAVGVALTCLNFFLLRKLIGKWTSDAAKSGGGSMGGQLLVLPKMIGMMAAVVLCLWLLPINAVAFAIGYSIFVVSIFAEMILSTFLPVPPEQDGTSEQTDG